MWGGIWGEPAVLLFLQSNRRAKIGTNPPGTAKGPNFKASGRVGRRGRGVVLRLHEKGHFTCEKTVFSMDFARLSMKSTDRWTHAVGHIRLSFHQKANRLLLLPFGHAISLEVKAMKILISDAFDPSLPGRLSKFGEVFDDKERLAEAEAVLVRSKTKCTKEYIDSAPDLKLIIRGGVGIDNIDVEYAKTKGIEVRNTPAASSVAVAEVAMALMLAVPNKVPFGHEGMVKGEWRKKEIKRTELFKKTLGLVGIGRIATEVAIRAKAFGMKVVAYDKYVDSSDQAEMMSLDEVLAQADYLSLHTPLTDETKGMINKDALAKMKDGAIIINTGRGKCVVEEDVVAALESGKLAGFGSDVWYSDPPENTPIAKAPNTVMLPHVGASSKENLLRIGDICVEIFEEFTAK